MDASGSILDKAPAGAVEGPSSPSSNREGFIDHVIDALRTVYDPEISVNIYDLGLIYRIDVKDAGVVEIDMTLTAPGCPVASEMLRWVEKAVTSLEGVMDAKVNLVFEPPWDPSRMSEETKLELGLE